MGWRRSKPARTRETRSSSRLIAPAQKILYFAAPAAATEHASQLPLLLEKRPDLAMTPNDDGVELRMRGEAKQQLWIAADTRESDVAVYLDSWRRKIERVGTMNFPDVARREKLSGHPGDRGDHRLGRQTRCKPSFGAAAGMRKSTRPP